jgi:hypothetical protein
MSKSRFIEVEILDYRKIGSVFSIQPHYSNIPEFHYSRFRINFKGKAELAVS